MNASSVVWMSSARRSRPRRTWPQRLVLGLNVLVVATALLSAVVLAYARETVSDIPRVGLGLVLDDASEVAGGQGEEGEDALDERSPALNFLLVGTDSIANLPPGHPLRLTRSDHLLTDTMIVMRVDPETGQASAVSIPRDLWVPIAGAGRNDKINSALALGGAETLIATIQESLNIPINRYVQVDFNGFLELIRVIGGLDVFIEYPLRDIKAQFEVNQTGCVNLTPDQALGYVRARSLQALINGSWVGVDGTGDLGRIGRQQDFLVLALNRAFSRGLTDPGTLKGLVEDVLGGGFVTLDDVLTPDELLQLGSDFRSFAGDDLQRHTLPVVLGRAGEASVVRLVEAEAQQVLSIFRGEAFVDRAFRLAVRNGTGSAGVADEVSFVLEAAGFNVVEASNADRFGYEASVIRFDPSQRANAVELERWLVSAAVLQERDQDGGGVVEFIVGEDYQGLLETPRELPESADGVPPVGTSEQVLTTDIPEPTPTPTPTPQAIATIRGC